MNSGTLRADLPRALAAAWLLLTAVLVLTTLIPLLVPAEHLHGLVPTCAARLRGESCILCGMTTGYVRIAQGDLAGAAAVNMAALPLYFGSWLNFALVSAYWIFKGERCNFLR